MGRSRTAIFAVKGAEMELIDQSYNKGISRTKAFLTKQAVETTEKFKPVALEDVEFENRQNSETNFTSHFWPINIPI